MSDNSKHDAARRQFLRRGGAAAGVAAVAAAVPLQALASRAITPGPLSGANRLSRVAGRVDPAYGPLYPTFDATTGLPLLKLPKGFRYLTFGWAGDALDSGAPTPGGHDGMAAFDGPNGEVVLIRNHELTSGGSFGDAAITYNPASGGGTTSLRFDPEAGAFLGSVPSIAGTVRNCAGGPTPWGSWLTCEETLNGPEKGNAELPHGYVFEVPVEGRAAPVPLKAMGRFYHEAVAVDPQSGILYQTEDRGTAGFYRFIPNTPGRLVDGGTLQMLAVAGDPQRDLRSGLEINDSFPVAWVTIDDPDMPHSNPGAPAGELDNLGVYRQGFDKGGAVFARLEGCWHGAGKIYFTATSGGDSNLGQVWEYDPARGVLRLVYESFSVELLDSPDNLTVSPRGGLLLCEDGGYPCDLRGLTVDGEIFHFAENNVELWEQPRRLIQALQANGLPGGITDRAAFQLLEALGTSAGDFRGREFAGATYSPDGRWLFVNIQTPGITFAITGPWGLGKL